MAANEIHIADIGTIFEITLMDDLVIVDISTATLMEIIFVKPDASKVTNIAALVTDGTDGKMKYTILVDTELDQTGSWKIQGRVVMPTGTWSSDIDKFKVYGNL